MSLSSSSSSSTADATPPAARLRMPGGPIAVIAVSVFLNVAGFTLVIPVMPFLVGRYVAPATIGLQVGLIVAVYAACAFVASPVLGNLSDRFGRRPVLLLSLAGSTLGYLVFGFGGALWVLYLGRIIDGLTAGNISTMYAAIADIAKPAERGRVYGLMGAVGGLGFMLGPVIGGVLGGIDPVAPVFVAAALMLANLAWVALALPESAPPERAALTRHALNPFGPLVRAATIAPLRVALGASFLFFLAGALLQSNFAVFLQSVMTFGPMGIGWVLFAVGVMDIVSQGLLARTLLRWTSETALARTGLLINAAGFCLIAAVAFAPSVTLLVIAMVVFTLGDGLFQPPASGLIANAAPAGAQGMVQGANQAQQALARTVGPLIVAGVSDLGASAPYWTAALIAFAGFILLCMKKPTPSDVG